MTTKLAGSTNLSPAGLPVLGAAGSRTNGDHVSQSGLADAVAGYMSPVIPAPLRHYVGVAQEIRGWLQPEILTVIGVLGDLYTRVGLTGGSVEIGVHHGLFYIALAKALGGEARGVAIDVFEDQHLNPDGSGHGDLSAFQDNMARVGLDPHRHRILQRDSMAVTPAEIRDAMDGESILLFSVDGAHTAEYTASDLTLAAECIHDWGVIVVDDLFNGRWPGVIDGVLKWMRSGAGSDFEMIAYGNNKGFLARAETARILRPLLANRMLGRADKVAFADKPSSFCRFRSVQELEGSDRRSPKIQKGKVYSFAADGEGIDWLVAGWAKPDASGVWSKAQETVLRLPIQSSGGACTLTLRTRGFLPKGLSNRVDVFIGLRKVASHALRPEETQIVIDVPEGDGHNFLELTFVFDKIYRPSEAGISADVRELAMRLLSLKIG